MARAREPGEELTAMHPHGSPQQKREYTRTVNRTAHFISGLPAHHQEAGALWYPEVHDYAVREAKTHGISTQQAAGVISAVSPAMEFEGRNRSVLDEIGGLSRANWRMVQRSAAAAGGRHPEVAAMLKEKAPSLATTTDVFALQAHDIYTGRRHPHEVLPYTTSPKRHSFMSGIENPESEHVTIDYRAHDVMTNRMMSVGKTAPDRGIASAGSSRGLTRYEVLAQGHRDVSRLLGGQFGGPGGGMRVQAAAWLGGKDIETMAHTAAGTRRVKGVHRELQPYMTPRGAALTPSGEDPRKAGWWER